MEVFLSDVSWPLPKDCKWIIPTIFSDRQKCVELNKSLETNQESFKRTTRALRLAMANLELQEENKVPMKKAE